MILLWIFLALIPLVALAVLGLAVRMAHRVLHPRRRPVGHTPDWAGIDRWEEVSFPTADGLTLRGWFIPPLGGSSRAAVIGLHGYRSNRLRFLDQAALLQRRGIATLLFDLRNHGESDGEITSLSLHEVRDVEAAVAYLASRPDVDQDKIALMGHSMGASTAIRAAQGIPQVQAVVAVAPFASLAQNIGDGVKAFIGPVGTLLAPLMVGLCELMLGAKASQVRPVDDLLHFGLRPLLLIHGSQDQVICPDNSRQLFQARPHCTQLHEVRQAGHNSVLSNSFFGLYQDQFLGFLEENLLERSPQAATALYPHQPKRIEPLAA